MLTLASSIFALGYFLPMDFMRVSQKTQVEEKLFE